MFLKPEIRVVFRKFFAFIFVFFVLLKFVHPKSRKLTFKTGFLVHNIYLNLCEQVENSKWILCSRETVLNFAISDVQRVFVVVI